MPKHKVSLTDRYTQHEGRIHLRGSQAMVRLLLMQRARDAAQGLNTAGFVSGYRGSPMTAIDEELWRAGKLLPDNHITFWPGINENLAMTSVWGTQQTNYYNDSTFDGVFGMWYGKGPGLDQTIDGLRQGNWHGADRNGGVLVCVGDDHNMTSTINNYSSELLFQDMFMPVVYPADIQEVLDLGLLGYALSRFCGAWIGFKLLPETIETSATVDADIHRVAVRLPEFQFPPEGVNAFLADSVYVQEARIKQYRLPAAIAFARANGMNRISHRAEQPRWGIVSMGKSWRETLQALADLGINERQLNELGISILKVGMPFPADLNTYREFARGLERVLIIEEKRELLADGFREACYDLPESARPMLLGRQDGEGKPLLDNSQPITTDHIAAALGKAFPNLLTLDSVTQRLQRIAQSAARPQALEAVGMQRIPYFCSGCPHNSSTKLPEGSRGQGGVGCHYMVTWMDRETYTFCQMGGEGATWIGQQAFVKTPHIFQNLGDGTYFHSGSLAIRAAVSAGVNITYKLLFNDAVAMTGGQPVDGQLTVQQISQQAALEGVHRVAVVSDEPEKYVGQPAFARGTSIHHRRELDAVQQDLRAVEGVSLLIYDQTCASEKRRRRKRGLYPDPAKRFFINDRVCEGCGDCGVASNCTSIQPMETPFGRKRRIDQSSCNKDYSCVEGFCPSFVTVEGGALRKATGTPNPALPKKPGKLPMPELEVLKPDSSYSILITGVGGTGIVTIGAVLGMAAHLDGRSVSVVDQLGFAQKGGSVVTHLRLGDPESTVHAARVNAGMADTLLACDMLVAGHDKIIPALDPTRTRGIVNTERNFTGDFARDGDIAFPVDTLQSRLQQSMHAEESSFFEASEVARILLGDALGANMLLTGFAWQRGLVPISETAILDAIALNGIAVEWNVEAFEWGRCLAHEPSLIEAILSATAQPVTVIELDSPAGIIERNIQELSSYQNHAYGQRYKDWLERFSGKVSNILGEDRELLKAVATTLFKLMAYKDEYEVARLHSDPAFHQRLAAQFEGDYQIRFNLAPPLLSPVDKHTGLPRKISLGSWMLPVFNMLAKCRFLRGTALDPFGYTAERKMERSLITDYQSLIDQLLPDLCSENRDLFLEIVTLPLSVKGYGHVKQAAYQNYQEALAQLLQQWPGQSAQQAA